VELAKALPECKALISLRCVAASSWKLCDSFQVSYWVDMHVYTPTSGFGHVCTCLQLSARLSAETKLFICKGRRVLLAVSVGHTGQEKTNLQHLPPLVSNLCASEQRTGRFRLFRSKCY